jgi:LPPG:FO 2-phospho-L-lactate transferase
VIADAGKPQMIVALAGGVGGAKLADGLANCLGEKLTVIVNTGDDFQHLGLYISPDLDTVMYTLAGIANPHTGWGVEGDTWSFLDQIVRLGGEDWFRLGDRDVATHVLRSERLRRGDRLTAVTADFCRSLGVASTVLPMSDGRVSTLIHSGNDVLTFQDYFVRHRCAVPVTMVSYEGAASVQPTPEMVDALSAEDLAAVIICPSNPYLSIDPILAIPGVRDRIVRASVPVIAISPIIGGAAVKGPAAKIMTELGLTPSVATVADHYAGLITALLIDGVDRHLVGEIEARGIRARATRTVMSTPRDRRVLARECIALAAELDDLCADLRR